MSDFVADFLWQIFIEISFLQIENMAATSWEVYLNSLAISSQQKYLKQVEVFQQYRATFTDDLSQVVSSYFTESYIRGIYGFTLWSTYSI